MPIHLMISMIVTTVRPFAEIQKKKHGVVPVFNVSNSHTHSIYSCQDIANCTDAFSETENAGMGYIFFSQFNKFSSCNLVMAVGIKTL